MIDIHSHIIPSIDDGSTTMEESIKMLELAEKDGNEMIIATPHYYRGAYEADFDTVKNETEKLKQYAKTQNMKIEIACGQEVLLDYDAIDLIKEGKIKGLNETRYILIEFPMDKLPEDAFDLIYELGILNLVPVLAHPERYRYIIEKPAKVNDFIDEGCLLQINSGSITGVFGKEVRKTSELLIKSGVCSFIASDAHNLRHRTPGLSEAIDIIQEYDDSLILGIYKNLSKMINNEELKLKENRLSEKKSIFSFLKI